jgi:hypothetical protein
MRHRVILYTRVGCHLCDDARDVVATTCAALGETWEEVDIDGDPDLRARYTDDIPVVTVDGLTIGFWRIDPERLRGALS